MRVRQSKKFVFFGNKALVKMEINVISCMLMIKKSFLYVDIFTNKEYAQKETIVYIDMYILNKNKILWPKFLAWELIMNHALIMKEDFVLKDSNVNFKCNILCSKLIILSYVKTIWRVSVLMDLIASGNI
jgi:hypothetical protein